MRLKTGAPLTSDYFTLISEGEYGNCETVLHFMAGMRKTLNRGKLW